MSEPVEFAIEMALLSQLAIAVIVACWGIGNAFQCADKACKCTLGTQSYVLVDRVVPVARDLVRQDFPE